jgi:hypothetical protein
MSTTHLRQRADRSSRGQSVSPEIHLAAQLGRMIGQHLARKAHQGAATAESRPGKRNGELKIHSDRPAAGPGDA